MKKMVSAVLALMILCQCGAASFGEEYTESDNDMSELTDVQRNSIGVLNYLSYLAKEIESQRGERLYLEQAYSALNNNLYMSSIDEVTLGQVKSLLTALYNFRMIAVKRERLQYLFERNQAQAIREAVPLPLAVMNLVESENVAKALVSIVYMAIESISDYASAKSTAEISYLESGWELDDEESEVIHEGRLDSIEYTWEIIHDYDLPAELAINETDIDRFVEWKSEPNVVSRIQFLESNQKVYQAFGEYWLVLAESYYENGDMENCLKAVYSYETYGTRIFRKDHHYAKVLTLAITAAAAVYDEEQYIAEASRFAEAIEKNSEQDDWVLHFFAAVTYEELATMTGENEYRQKAYDIVLNNVNYLAKEQRTMNQEYLAEIVPVTPAADATEERKKEITQYNEGVQAVRKTALPPVSDALVLNCDLLMQLADELNISTEDREKAEGILYGKGEKLFLCPAVDSLYHISSGSDTAGTELNISFDGEKITLSACQLTENTSIRVSGIDMKTGQVFSIDDWVCTDVARPDPSDQDSFVATFTSREASDFAYSEGSSVWIDVDPSGDGHTKSVQVFFTIVSKVDFLIPYLAFERVEG